MKRIAKEPEAPIKLYKVLTADGHSPYITAYSWSLPTQNADGRWTPGAWHEEPPSVFDKGHGLHITPEVSRYWPRDTCVAYECEAEGYREDPSTNCHVVALKVRLLRPVPSEEAMRVGREWSAGIYARRAKAGQKERLDCAREAAVRRKSETDAARAAGVASPALEAFRLLVELTPTESWRDANSCRHDALRYATEYLRFDPGDVAAIYDGFRGSYWFGCGSGSDERLYALAIEKGNLSACVAWEHFFGRKPWWYAGSDGKRARLHVGAQVWINGVWHKVTSFRDEYINAVRDSDRKVVKLAREQLAPKTSKVKVAA